MIDTHAHLTDETYAADLNNMISNFADDGLEKVFCVGFDYESSVNCVKLAEQYENVYAIIGVHPSEIHTLTDECVNFLNKSASNKKVIAIGEIGLDYHFTKDYINEQKQGFIKQLQIANHNNLPIIIHNRDAIGDTLQILKEHKNLLNNGGIVHCFNESVEVFNEIKKLGLIVGLGGVVTFKNAKNAPILISQLTLKDFVLETDCPYLTPEPLRGQCKNQPKFTRFVAQKIADIKNITFDEVVTATNENVYKLFKKVVR